MMEIVSRLWMMSLQASILILIVLIARIFLRKYPKIYTYCLWALVGIRLLCPVFVETPFSLQPDYARFSEEVQGQTAQGKLQSTQNSVQSYGTLISGGTDNVSLIDSQTVKENGRPQEGEADYNNIADTHKTVNNNIEEGLDINRILEIGALVYVIGIAVMIGVYLIQYLIIRNRIFTAVREKKNVWLCENISSPFVIGIFNSRIILPYNLEEQEKHHVLMHERTHIRHHDPFVRFVGLVCLCLHWWNPLVWLAVHKMNQDMEMFCDEAALKSASSEERKSYARTLLAFAERQSGFSVGLAFGESNTERRVKNIMNKRKGSFLIICVIVVLAVFCVMAFLTIPRGDEKDIPANNLPNNNIGETTGNNSNQNEDEEKEREQNINKQLDIIATNVNMWKLSPDFANEVYSYAITDLDQNGRLEVIASNMGGTGAYTYSLFYEVNEQLDSLTECQTNFVEGSSQPDIIEKAVWMYHDEAKNILYYIEDDMLKASPGEYYFVKSALSLKDGRVTISTLSTEIQRYFSEVGTILYENAKGEVITEEEYIKIADNTFAGCKKYKAGFGWREMAELEGANTQEIVALLKQSYESFVFSEGASDEARMNAYISVLENIYKSQYFPDGTKYDLQPDDADISLNQFAVYDIDSDGADELIIMYTTTYVAGETIRIYDYDNKQGIVREEFSEYPLVTFYENEVISAMASHNHGRAATRGDFWPYTLYRYDKGSDSYVQIASVDGWDKAYEVYGEVFPDAADTDGDGMVYYVMTEERLKYDAPIDFAEYNQWLSTYLEGAERLTIPFVNLTEENIRKIG